MLEIVHHGNGVSGVKLAFHHTPERLLGYLDSQPLELSRVCIWCESGRGETTSGTITATFATPPDGSGWHTLGVATTGPRACYGERTFLAPSRTIPLIPEAPPIGLSDVLSALSIVEVDGMTMRRQVTMEMLISMLADEIERRRRAEP